MQSWPENRRTMDLSAPGIYPLFVRKKHDALSERKLDLMLEEVLETLRPDAVVFVVRSGRVTRGVARHTLDRFRHVGAEIAGCVLNDVDIEGSAYAGSYYYQRYSYHPYSPEPLDDAPNRDAASG